MNSDEIRVVNPATVAHKAWVPIPIPYADAVGLPPICQLVSGQPLAARKSALAIRATEVGRHTVFYDALFDFSPGEDRTWRIGPHGAEAQYGFLASDWVDDDVSRVVPRGFVRERSGIIRNTDGQHTLTRIEQFPSHERWVWVARAGGMVFHVWLTFYALQDVVEIEGQAVYSDPSVTHLSYDVDRVWLEFGEFVHIDVGASAYRAPDGQWRVVISDRAEQLGDGQGFPVFVGALLCLHNTDTHSLLREPERANALHARRSGPAYVFRSWESRFLAFGATVPPGPNDTAELKQRLTRDREDLRLAPFEERWRGLEKRAGATGGKQGFGASKGSEITLPSLFHGNGILLVSQLEEPLRPFHYREEDGSIVRKSAHPDWWTWSQRTHWHENQSPDRLGKPANQPEPHFNGWTGDDDQHLEDNLLLALCAAFDRPALRAQLDDSIEVALANVRLRDQQTGAPRAVGRRLQRDASAWLLTDRADVLAHLCIDHAKTAATKLERHGMDTQTDSRLLNAPGQPMPKPIPTLKTWEIGLELKGACAVYAALARHDRDLEPHRTLVKLLAEGLLSTFRQNSAGYWYTWLEIHYDRKILPPENILSFGPEARVDPQSGRKVGQVSNRTFVTSAWSEWILPGLYYLEHAHHGIQLEEEAQDKLEDIIGEFDRRVGIQPSIASREWFAVAERIGPHTEPQF